MCLDCAHAKFGTPRPPRYETKLTKEQCIEILAVTAPHVAEALQHEAAGLRQLVQVQRGSTLGYSINLSFLLVS